MLDLSHYSASALTLLALYFTILGVLGIYGSHRYVIARLYRRYAMGRPDPAPLSRFAPDDLPVITVQLPLYNERYVASRLIHAVAALDYPRDRLEIQVLDDSTDDTTTICEAIVDTLRAGGLDIKLLHRVDRVGYKAGALAAGLLQARGQLIAVFDADFVPQASFLREVVDHFSDPGVGMVQARWEHLNRQFSLLTRAQAILLDGHFVLEHTARHRSGRFFNFNGTAGIWRRQAIEQGGGWQHDTLTEDLDLSYRAQLAGWRFIFLRDVTVPSEIPVEMNAFKAQQHRWAKGSIQTARKLLPRLLMSDLPWHIKLEATYHLTANLAYLLMLLLAAMMPLATLVRVHQGWREALLLDVPIFLSATCSVCLFYWMSQREIGRPRAEIARLLPAVLALGIGMCVNNARAVIEALIGYETPFVRTPKYAVEATSQGGLAHHRYSKKSTALTLAEVALAGWFGYAIFAVLTHSRVSPFSLPFLALFQLGFTYVAALSLSQGLGRWRQARRSAPEA